MAKWFEIQEAPLRLTARGAWLHGKEPLSPKIANLFARHVRVTPEGRYTVCLGQESAPLEVDDAAFVVRSLATDNSSGTLRAVTFVASDGAKEVLDPASLMQSETNVLYCRVVRDGLGVPCRFSPGHYHALALFAEPALNGEGYDLLVDGERYPIGPYVAQPVRPTVLT